MQHAVRQQELELPFTLEGLEGKMFRPMAITVCSAIFGSLLLSLTVVPFFTRARVYTAYEYLERRFDLKTRTLAALIFFVQRGLSCGVVIAAPARFSRPESVDA